MKKFLLCLVILMFTFNCYAYTTSEIIKYLHKKVLITYTNDDNHLAVIVGNLLIIANPKNDYTMADFYAYLIIETKNSLEIVKVKNIDIIRLYKDIVKE